MASTARLDELKKKFDENPRRYFAPLANEHRKSGDLDQAISLCRAHLPQQPAHISGHIVLAQALFEAGSIDESREIFLASLGLDPENLIALRYLGDIARESEDVETARSWYTRVLEVDPRNDEIVQLVRDLDKPRPAAAPEPTIASEEALEAVDLSPVAEPVVANDDARFAPISMEDFDVGSDQPAVTSDAPRADVAESAASEMSFDVHAAWNTESAPGGDSTLDAPELDPFDLHPLASAESLFDDGSDTAANDLFLNELSGGNAPDAGDLMADEVPDAWSASTAELPATSDARAASFEEGLYLEPPPAAPTEQTAPESDDAFVAETFVVSEEPSQAPTVTGSHDAVTMKDPNADALALFADTQTAEWQPPTSDVASIAHTTDTLGLEVMEFVPPSSEATPSSILEPPSDADPLLGRTPDLTSAEQETGPAAFVTETMAELYLQQGFRNEALAVYRELLSRNPADANLRERVDQIESGSMSSLGMATLSEEVVESALKRQTGGPSRSVRSFFASLASRRAPAPPPQSSYYVANTTDAASDAPSIDQATSYVQDVAPESMSMPEPVIDAPASPESERSTLLSAAETLAQFDPFADTAELTPPSVAHTSAEVPDAWSAMPTPMSSPAVTPAAALGEPRTDDVSNAPAIEPVAAVDPAPARRSLEDLFPNAPVTARTEAAAQTFATAFGRDEPQGRPTRAASNELSLDHVFRGSAESAAAPDGGFSFDQFFSDARPSGGDVAAPVVSAPDTGRSAGPSGDAHDIEQFTAWLEGLKKK